MPQIPRGSSLLSRPAGSTVLPPGDPLGGLAIGSAGRTGAGAGAGAFLDPLFAPLVREQFSLFDELGRSGLQPLQARAFAPTRQELVTQLERVLEQQGRGGVSQVQPKGPGPPGTPRFIVDPEAEEQLTLLGQAARGAITGLRTLPVRFRAKGGLITRRAGIV